MSAKTPRFGDHSHRTWFHAFDDGEPDCPYCVQQDGLCTYHERGILPLLAVNLGWLMMMGEIRTEQKRRQAATNVASEKAKRREARKQARRGMAGLLTHIRTAA